MADIKFYCPNCSGKLGIDEKAAGLLVDCPLCGKEIQIPRASSPPPAAAPAPARPQPAAAPPSIIPGNRPSPLKVAPLTAPPKMDLSAVTQAIPTPPQLKLPVAPPADRAPVLDTVRTALQARIAQLEEAQKAAEQNTDELKRWAEKAEARARAEEEKAAAALEKVDELEKRLQGAAPLAVRVEQLLKQVAELADQRAATQRELDSQSAAKQLLAQQLAGLESAAQQARAAEAGVRGEAEGLRRQVVELRQAAEAAARQAAARQSEAEAQAQRDVEALRTQVADLQKAAEAAALAANGRQGEVEPLKKQLAELQAAATTASAQAAKQQQESARQAAAWKLEKETLEGALLEARARIEKLSAVERRVADLQARIVAAEAERERLAKAPAPERVQDPEAAGQIIAGLQESVEELKRRLGEADGRQAQGQRDLQRLKEQVAQGQQLVKQADAKANAAREENLKLVLERDQLRKELSDLKARSRDFEIRDKETQSLSDQITRLQAQIAQLRSEESQLTSVIRNVEGKVERTEPPPAAAAPAPALPIVPKARPVSAPAASRRLMILVGAGCFLFGVVAMFLVLRTPEGGAGGVSPEPVVTGDSTGMTHDEDKEAVPLGTPTLVDDVEIVVDKVEQRRVMKTDPLGVQAPSDQPYLVVSLSLQNRLTDRSTFLLHTWEQAKVMDEQQNALRPAFPGRFALDQVEGMQTQGEMAPGEKLKDVLVFELPAPTASSFTLVADPGFWKKTDRGNFIPVSRTTFRVSFSRSEIVVTDEPAPEPAPVAAPSPDADQTTPSS